MTPEEFERYVACIFESKGYKTEVTRYSGDYGVDVFAFKGKEKIAIQVKKFGNCTRKVNRNVFLKLYGSQHFFDCTKAIVATDGKVMDDAVEVAKKLGIEIFFVDTKNIEKCKPDNQSTVNDAITEDNRLYPDFSLIWDNFIRPLEGKTLFNSRGPNRILEVNNTALIRSSINDISGEINRDYFKLAYEYLTKKGSVTRDYINQQIDKGCSSIIFLVLAQLPFIEESKNPQTLKMKSEYIYK